MDDRKTMIMHCWKVKSNFTARKGGLLYVVTLLEFEQDYLRIEFLVASYGKTETTITLATHDTTREDKKFFKDMGYTIK